MLELRQVTRDFGGRRAVDTVSLRFDRPGFVGIIGRSGAGKSTLLRMVNRLTDVTSGAILFEGRDVAEFPTTFEAAHACRDHRIAVTMGRRT